MNVDVRSVAMSHKKSISACVECNKTGNNTAHCLNPLQTKWSSECIYK